ncbi:MAG: YcaQ family DNA glycosylase [Anaerolineales bacterium]|nr:YcaQ family DNA glycosylase [Anaerolineales bacterium]
MSAVTLSPAQARRLALDAQLLAGPRPAPDTAGLLATARRLRCLQLDPISVVARSHQLVLFSRVGPYDLAHLDRLLWEERRLFEYWAHCASIVLTEDYPLHRRRMLGYPSGTGKWSLRTRAWVKANAPLRQQLLRLIRRRGPVLSRDLEEAGLAPEAWVSGGWTSGRNVSQMLDYLWLSGQIMVAGRQGGQKAWDLTRRVLPAWTPRERLGERAATGRAIEHALRALGVGTAKHIRYHFVRGRYPYFEEAVGDLEKAGRVRRVEVAGWAGPWYALPEALEAPAPEAPARAALLSPFDNLIADRTRTAQLFDFDYKIAIYTPAAQRQYGYYVLPILHGERLIGRLDPEFDRAAGVLRVNTVHAEAGAPKDAGPAIAAALTELAQFLHAGAIQVNRQRAPAAWQRALRF